MEIFRRKSETQTTLQCFLVVNKPVIMKTFFQKIRRSKSQHSVKRNRNPVMVVSINTLSFVSPGIKKKSGMFNLQSYCELKQIINVLFNMYREVGFLESRLINNIDFINGSYVLCEVSLYIIINFFLLLKWIFAFFPKKHSVFFAINQNLIIKDIKHIF